ncbi:MAG: hypothetical protein K2K25_00565, partial [Muribaculaceae bacterium]|nr:hypothetical protein [Muribaculaceae bacterium]
MTELEMMRWVLGILITAGALAVTVMYFYRNDENPAIVAVNSVDSRTVLLQRLMSLSRDGGSIIPLTILESDVYETIQQNIRNGSIIKESSPIWDELEKIIVKCSPKFKSNLYVL